MAEPTRPAQAAPSQEGHRAIGEHLLQARTRQGLTWYDVSDLTRITPDTLRRVEAGEFDQLGGDVYARGHIRAYAQAVGLEPEPLLAMYGTVHLPPLTKRDLRKPRTVTPAPPRTDKPLGSARKDARQAATNRARAVLPTIVPGAVPSLVPMVGANPPPDLPALRQPRRRADYTDADSGSAAHLVEPAASEGAAVNQAPAAFLGGGKSEPRSGPNWTLALLGAVGAVGMVAAVQLWPHSNGTTAPTGAAGASVPQVHSASPAVAPAATAKPAVPAPPAPPAPAVPAPPAAPAAPTATAPVDLKISTKDGPVWVGVTNSAGQQLYWNMLAADQTKEFTDTTRLDVTVGDASGVAMQINGKDLETPSGDGQAMTASFGPAGQL